MYDSVLLPIDLNHPASWEKALPAALELVNEGGALHLLAILPDFGESMVSSFFPADFQKQALGRAHEALAAFAAEHAPGAQHHVGFGHVPETILKTAAATGAELIVMASHPPDELRNLLVGSNAEKVVRHAPTPVLVMR